MSKARGLRGEEIAESHLRGLGYKILGRNVRTPYGELDIIALDGDAVVFCEVKSRTSGAFGHPGEAVNRKKREHLIKSALYYSSKGKSQPRMRFDVICVMLRESGADVEHIKDAFESRTG